MGKRKWREGHPKLYIPGQGVPLDYNPEPIVQAFIDSVQLYDRQPTALNWLFTTLRGDGRVIFRPTVNKEGLVEKIVSSYTSMLKNAVYDDKKELKEEFRITLYKRSQSPAKLTDDNLTQMYDQPFIEELRMSNQFKTLSVAAAYAYDEGMQKVVDLDLHVKISDDTWYEISQAPRDMARLRLILKDLLQIYEPCI